MKAGKEPCNESWKKFLRRHSGMSLLMILMIAVAAVVAVSVFLWVVADAQATGLVPVAIGEWTVGYYITFILTAIMWELIFVGTWVIPAVIIIYQQWYKRLPEEERDEYQGKHGRRKSTKENSGFSFFIGLIWLVIVWIDGKWNLAFQSWTLNDWVFSWLSACLWGLLIVGIPGIMYVIWSLTRDVPEKKGKA